MPNKTDKQDAHALARLAHAGCMRPVAGKSRHAQLVRALLTARQQVKGQRLGSRRSAPSGSPQAASTSAV